MALEACIDDSGRGRGPVFVLAGFVAPAAQWAALTERWQAILDDPCSNGSLKLDYFKTFEAITLTGQFAGWDSQVRDQCMLRFAGLAAEHALFRIRVAIPMKAFNSVFRRKLSPSMDSPYFLAFHSIMMEMIRHQMDHGQRDPVDFIFDNQGGRERRDVERGFTTFRWGAPAQCRHLIGTRDPIFRDDKEFLPLQAADLMAWHARTVLAMLRQKGREYDSEVWRRLREIPPIEREWGRVTMSEILRGSRGLTAALGGTFPYDLPPSDPRRRAG